MCLIYNKEQNSLVSTLQFLFSKNKDIYTEQCNAEQKFTPVKEIINFIIVIASLYLLSSYSVLANILNITI